jgi:hypothetical protein
MTLLVMLLTISAAMPMGNIIIFQDAIASEMLSDRYDNSQLRSWK